MGIDISAKLIYGLRYSDVPEDIIEQIDEELDDGSLDYASLYYDAPVEDWIIGVEIYAHGASRKGVTIQPENAENNFPSYIRNHSEVVLGCFVVPHVY